MKELICANLWFLSKSEMMLGQCLESGERWFVLRFFKKKGKNYYLGDGYIFFPLQNQCLFELSHPWPHIRTKAGKELWGGSLSAWLHECFL